MFLTVYRAQISNICDGSFFKKILPIKSNLLSISSMHNCFKRFFKYHNFFQIFQIYAIVFQHFLDLTHGQIIYFWYKFIFFLPNFNTICQNIQIKKYTVNIYFIILKNIQIKQYIVNIYFIILTSFCNTFSLWCFLFNMSEFCPSSCPINTNA